MALGCIALDCNFLLFCCHLVVSSVSAFENFVLSGAVLKLWFSTMPPKKGSGKSKGKQPAKKVAQKRAAEPAPLNQSNLEAQRLILLQLEAMEKAQGISPGGPPAAVTRSGGKLTHPISQQCFQAQVCDHLLFLGKSLGTGDKDGGTHPTDEQTHPADISAPGTSGPVVPMPSGSRWPDQGG